MLSLKKIDESVKVFEDMYNVPKNNGNSCSWNSKKLEYSGIDHYYPNLFYTYCQSNSIQKAQNLFGKAFWFHSRNNEYKTGYNDYYKFIFKEMFPKAFSNDFIAQMKNHQAEALPENCKALYDQAIKVYYSKLKSDDALFKKTLEILRQAEKLSKSMLIQFQIFRFTERIEPTLNSLIEKDPLYVASYFHIGLNLWSDSRNCSLEYYNLINAMEPNENDIEGNFEKAEFLFNCVKKYPEALTYYKKVPNSYLYAVLNQGIIYSTEKQIDKAIEKFDLFIKLFPEYDIAYLKKSEIVDVQELNKFLPEWATKFPKSESLPKRISEYIASKDTYENKVMIGMTYMTYLPNDRNFAIKLFENIEASVYDPNGFTVEKCKISLQNLLDFCDKILKDPQYKGWNDTCALTNNMKGSVLVALKKPEEALLCFEKALENLKNYALYFCNKGEALNLIGKPIQALPCFEKAYTSMKNNQISYFSKISDQLIKYVKNIIDRERKKVLTSLIDSIQKHSINQEEVKGK